jgi:hypothetical protein
MASIVIIGQDIIKINGRIISSLADGDAGVLAYNGNLVTIKTGLNGNSIYAFNEGGRQCTLALKLVRGSADDCFLNRLFALMKADFSSFTLLTGEIVKRFGDGNGNVIEETYILSGGVFAKEVDVKTNTSGGADQPVVTWTFMFTNAPRTIG